MPAAMPNAVIAAIISFIIRAAILLVLASIGWVVSYKWINPPITWLMARDAIAGRHVEHEWVALDAITRAVPRALIGAEDAQFCAHRGFDLAAIEKAAMANASGKRLRGGSTISQQVAKNAFLWPGRSYLRKGLEAWFTLLIEQIWGKQRIMEVYVNIVEMGPGIYGVEAASRHYFNKGAAQLTARQAARIATVLPNPVERDPTELRGKLRRKARAIEKRVRVVRDEKIDACLY
jgi:monofunctional biosynthetic peptidoglycan transglycosylase